MNPIGITLILTATLIPLYWYLPHTKQHDTLAVISQYLGSVSLILMGIVQFMATRARGIEAIFGGLDRIYVLHKWLAVIAIVFAALHDTIDADMSGLGAETFLTDVAETFGELGFYGILILGLITIISFVPYQYWKWSHRFIGLFFALSAIHFAFILKPFSNTEPLGLYILSFCALGVVSYLYLLLPKHWTSQTTDYQVTQLTKMDDALEVQLSPKGRGITHQAGQFAFISLQQAEQCEPHPFTISAAPNAQRTLRFSIKHLGDYTTQLAQHLEIGSNIKLSRAYGHFTQPTKPSPQIWVAAGIGITPFMAWAQTLEHTLKQPITLYYCVKDKAQALYLTELQEIAKQVAHFEVNLLVSGVHTRLSAQQIHQAAGATLADQQLYFCGPKIMREQLKTELVELGLKRTAFHYEEFEIRSGIGIRKALAWLLARYGDKLFSRLLEK